MMNAEESVSSFFQFPSLDDIKQYIFSKQDLIKSQYMNCIDTDQVNATRLVEKIQHSFSAIHEAFEKYNYLSLSFNGGKDSIVLLNLVLWIYIHSTFSKPKELLVFHFFNAQNFPEMNAFIEDCSNTTYSKYLKNIKIIDGSKGFKLALQELKDAQPNLEAIFMGVRRTDPHGSKMNVFEPTSQGWPQMMRVNAILEWDYHDIWNFILLFSIPYCKLYDEGYTSLGEIHNTIKNVALLRKENENHYKPAYHLLDGSKERDSRK